MSPFTKACNAWVEYVHDEKKVTEFIRATQELTKEQLVDVLSYAAGWRMQQFIDFPGIAGNGRGENK